MTAKQVFEYTLVELNKREAPSLLLEDYNYFVNKAVSQYINRTYNLYDINQQKTDDLRVLKSSAVLTPINIENEYSNSTLFDKVYKVDLPDDYLHILNCVVEYKLLKRYKCHDKDSSLYQGAIRLTSDQFPQLINNYYLKPNYKRPYFYIANNNIVNNYPVSDNIISIIDSKYVIELTSQNITTSSKVIINTSTEEKTIICTSNMTPTLLKSSIVSAFPSLDTFITISNNTLIIKDSAVSNITVRGPGLILYKTPSASRIAENRYGNKSKVRMEIRYGEDDVFQLQKVIVDYLRSPQFIKLTQDQLDDVEDTSQILEFPDYVCQEVINELVKLLLENAIDPRLQSHIPVTQTIPSQLPYDRKK